MSVWNEGREWSCVIAVLIACQAAVKGLSEQLHSVLVEITNGTVAVTPSETECEDLLYWAECCRDLISEIASGVNLIWALNADSIANYSSMKNQ